MILYELRRLLFGETFTDARLVMSAEWLRTFRDATVAE